MDLGNMSKKPIHGFSQPGKTRMQSCPSRILHGLRPPAISVYLPLLLSLFLSGCNVPRNSEISLVQWPDGSFSWVVIPLDREVQTIETPPDAAPDEEYEDIPGDRLESVKDEISY